MIYFLALLPATILTIAGYGVLFLAQRSEGSLKSFGRYLGFWAFTLAGLVVLGAIFAAARGPMMHTMMMHGDGDEARMCPWHEMHSWRRSPQEARRACLQRPRCRPHRRKARRKNSRYCEPVSPAATQEVLRSRLP